MYILYTHIYRPCDVKGALRFCKERGGARCAWGHIRILYKAPENYTKPQNTIQRYNILTIFDKQSKKTTNLFSKKHAWKQHAAGRLRLENMGWG